MFVKPGELKGLTVITIHVPDQVVPGKYTVRHEIRNIAGKVILSDDIDKDSMAYICRAVNGAEILEQQVKEQQQQDQDKPGRELLRLTLIGRTVLKKDTKTVIQDDDGNFSLRPTTAYIKWLNYHRRKRLQYLGTWAKMNIAVPVNISMKFIMPRTAHETNMHKLVEATLEALEHMGVLYAVKSDIVRSINGTEIIHTDGTEYSTHIVITRIGGDQPGVRSRRKTKRKKS